MILNDRFIVTPINFENEQIGTLALIISERLYEEIDLAFARSNNQTLRFSAIAGLLFAQIIARAHNEYNWTYQEIRSRNEKFDQW